MSAYLTTELVQANLRDDFDALYSLPLDQGALTRDILTAETEVNASLTRYRLPLTDSDAITYATSIALAVFAEIAWRRGAGEDIPEKIKEAAKTARAQLKDLRGGAAQISGSDATENEQAAGAIVSDANAPQFDRANMEGY